MINYKVYNLIKELNKSLKETILEEKDIRVALYTLVPLDKIEEIEGDVPEGTTHKLIESDISIADYGTYYQGSEFWVHIDDEEEYFTDDINEILGSGIGTTSATKDEAVQWLRENSQGSPVYEIYKEGANTVTQIVE